MRTIIEAGKTVLGIELGSTRIKAVLINENHEPIASGSYEWENRLENGIWTYSLEDAWSGLQACYADLRSDVQKKYGVGLKKIGAIGIKDIHCVCMRKPFGFGIKINFHRSIARRKLNGTVGSMSLPRFGKRSIENNAQPLCLRMRGDKRLYRLRRPHRMRAGGPFSYFIYFSNRLHISNIPF